MFTTSGPVAEIIVFSEVSLSSECAVRTDIAFERLRVLTEDALLNH